MDKRRSKDLANEHVELGTIDWSRSHEEALERAARSDRPVFLLFTEVPGCSTVKGYGRRVLSDPLLADAIEAHFVPLAIFNNKKGKDREVLKAYGEPTWNNPAVRIVNEEQEAVVPRLYGDYSELATLERIQEAIREREGELPAYLELYREALVAKERKEKAYLNMYCFWSGEAGAGRIEGVLGTRPGFMEGTEVVQVTYDPQRISYAGLLRKAKKNGVASGCFVRSEDRLEDASKVFGEKAERSSSSFRYSADDDDHSIQGTPYEELELKEIQRTHVNSALASGRDPGSYLSPQQRELVDRIRP